MHNINFIRENPIEFDNAMKQRGEQSLSKKILEIDEQKRTTQTLLQNLLAERNTLSNNWINGFICNVKNRLFNKDI